MRWVIKSRCARLSIADTVEVLHHVQPEVAQANTRLVMAPAVLTDKCAVKAGRITVPCNRVITKLNLAESFTASLRCKLDEPPGGLMLECRFRLLGSSLKGRIAGARG